MKLRPYQEQVIRDVEQALNAGHRRICLMMATGAGKTATAAELIRQMFDAGGQSLFVVDRIELVAQSVRHLEALGLRCGVLQGANTDYRATDDVVVASIQTISARGLNFTPKLIVVDECHILHKAHLELMRQRDRVPVIGLSATPLRKGLGKVFTALIKGPPIRWLIDHGYLVPLDAYGPATTAVNRATQKIGLTGGDFVRTQLSTAMQSKVLIADLIGTWQQKADGRPTLLFATDVAHSQAVVNDFLAAGIHAVHLDAHTPDSERKRVVDKFKAGEISILSSVGVLTVGFDAPIASCAILARPTLSRALHLQQLGRVMRPAPGKENALILDHAGNLARHGMPDQFELHSLDDDEIEAKRKVKRRKRVMRPCRECGHMLKTSEYECPACGLERSRPNRVHVRDGTLVNLKSGQAATLPVDRQRFYQELRHVAASRGYNPGWCAHKYRERYGEFPPRAWNGLQPIPATPQTLRWVQSQLIKYLKGKQMEPA